MSFWPQPPSMPEEDGYVVSVRQEPPAAGESVASWFYFSLTRLIIATAMALSPYWPVPTDNEPAKIVLMVIAVFVVLLAFNLYSLLDKLPESLDERPDLGYLYHAMTIFIPQAT